MKNNYHTHTTRCKHAGGSDEAYVLSAIKGGFTELGFSEHCPWKYKTNFIAGMRMRLEELPGYVNSIRDLKENYKDQISIKLGLECEYFPEYIPWLKETADAYELDYMIFGNHYYKSDETSLYYGAYPDKRELLKNYLESSLEGMESGLFAYFAHPDLFMRGYPEFDEHCEDISLQIIHRALELNMILEYNLAGLKFNYANRVGGYPHPEFWKIAAKKGCNIIIGVDAHNNKHLESSDSYNTAVSFLGDMGANLVNQIPFRR